MTNFPENPFEHLPVATNEEELSGEFLQRWVMPLYLRCLRPFENFDGDEPLELVFRGCMDIITEDVVSKLLGDCNWRCRIVGAYLAALQGYRSFETWIGHLLLRSEVCFAGKGYCIALSSFNTEQSISFLVQYLRHYLGEPELEYDQHFAMATLHYLDRLNQTNVCGGILDDWQRYCEQTLFDSEEHMRMILQSVEAIHNMLHRVVNGR